MADTFEYTGSDGGYLIDFTNQVINCSISMDTLHCQDLVNACRTAEDSEIGVAYSKICNASGKEYLDTLSGVQVAITCVLLSNWVVYSLKDFGVFRVMGGNLVQVSGGDVFLENTALTYINYQSAAGTIVQVSTGSGLSSEEHAKLMTLVSEIRMQQLLFNRTNTVDGSSRINSYMAGGDVSVGVTYDGNGVPTKEEIG